MLSTWYGNVSPNMADYDLGMEYGESDVFTHLLSNRGDCLQSSVNQNVMTLMTSETGFPATRLQTQKPCMAVTTATTHN